MGRGRGRLLISECRSGPRTDRAIDLMAASLPSGFGASRFAEGDRSAAARDAPTLTCRIRKARIHREI